MKNVEVRVMDYKVFNLCKELELYTLGNSEDYGKMLHSCKECVDFAQVEKIARNIAIHSDCEEFINFTGLNINDFVNYIHFELLNHCCVYIPVIE